MVNEWDITSGVVKRSITIPPGMSVPEKGHRLKLKHSEKQLITVDTEVTNLRGEINE